MPHPSPPPPPQPPQQPPHHPPQSLSNPPTFPDFLLTALSLFLLITTPKHLHLHNHHHLTPPRATSLTTSTRRFLRSTSSSSSPLMSHHNHPRPRLFPTPQSLSDWLKPRLPPSSFALWGHEPGTKNIHNLWLELEDGETSLIDNIPPLRTLEVICVNVINKSNQQHLIESKQELSDGSVRVRNRPLSEKLKSGEDIETGVIRAIKEELGSVITANFDEVVEVDMGSYNKRVEERNSVSYPGLPACYVLHNVDAFVEGLPDGEFVTEEGDEYEGCDHGVAGGAVAVKRHFWKWVDRENV